MASDYIRIQDLYDIPDARVPVCLCLDTSGSMNTTKGGTRTGRKVTVDKKDYYEVTGGVSRLDILQKGIQAFYDAVYKDENARYAAEISIVTFDDTAKVQTDFSRVEYNDVREEVPKLTAGGNTSLGLGINKALDRLEQRKKEYKDSGVDYFQPWLVIMTDGENNLFPEELDKARRRIKKMVEEKRLCVYPFIIGTDEGKDTLASLSPKQPPLRIEITQMQGLFKWLGSSVAQASSGSIGTGNAPVLTVFEVKDWGEPLE